ncbi:MAG: ParA family protein [Spirochaetes bacterium]|nr:ParA family protein [Spirochaetota bacterium]
MKNKIISISNQKGGVAKTSTCINLGLALGLYKNNVLLIDLDAQSNLSLALGLKDKKSIYDVLSSGNGDLSGIIIKTDFTNLSVIPSNGNMGLMSREYFGRPDYEYMLQDKFEALRDKYDFILIDTPPSLGFFSVNALTSSDMVIIPSQCEYLSVVGVKQTMTIIHTVKNKIKKDLPFRILVAMYDQRNNVEQMFYAQLKKTYGDKLYNTIISTDTKVKESQIVGKPVIYYSKKSKAGLQYLTLAKEILGGMTNGQQ